MRHHRPLRRQALALALTRRRLLHPRWDTECEMQAPAMAAHAIA